MDITLYYFPGSYCCNKVLLALYEKNIPFKEKFVKININENYESWFEKLNPKRQVPVIKCGNDVITDSDDIIDYLSRKFDTDNIQLVPDRSTAQGEEVTEFRNFISQLPIRYIVLGLAANPRLQLKRMRFHEVLTKLFTRKSIEKKLDDGIARLQKKPSSAEVVEAIEGMQRAKTIVLDESRVEDVYRDLEQTFDRIEQTLDLSKKSTRSGEFWLFGPKFSAADISTAIFLYRIYELGMDERYFSETKRPLVNNYYLRLIQRPAFQKMVAKNGEAEELMRRAQRGVSTVKLVKIGIIVGVAAVVLLGVREIWTARRGFAKA